MPGAHAPLVVSSPTPAGRSEPAPFVFVSPLVEGQSERGEEKKKVKLLAGSPLKDFTSVVPIPPWFVEFSLPLSLSLSGFVTPCVLKDRSP